MYEVVADNGIFQQRVRMSQAEVTKMITTSLFESAIASCEIEGISTDGIVIPEDLTIPNSLLRCGN